MKISRRKVVIAGTGFAAASLLPLNLLAQSDGQSAEDIIKEFTGGANISSGDIMLTTPEIAENGNTVPFSV
jgi:sulfur-oxidizing protein SoxY